MMTMPLDGFRPGQPLPLSKLIQEAGGQARFKTACVEKVLGDAMSLVSGTHSLSNHWSYARTRVWHGRVCKVQRSLVRSLVWVSSHQCQ